MALPAKHAEDWLKSASYALPEGYSLDARGTYQHMPPKPGCPDGQVIKLASCPITVSARARNDAGGAWSMRLEFLSPDGAVCHVLVSATELNSRQSTIVDRLAYQGVLVEPGAQLNFRSYLFAANSNPTLPRLMLASRLGFQRDPNNGRWVFVLPDTTIRADDMDEGAVTREEIVFSPAVRASTVDAYKASGTLAEWKAAVAPFADNPLIQLGILYGLAGPFAIVAGVENGGIHIFGESSTGKSTALQACASVAGCGADTARSGAGEALFQRWHSTTNAVEGMVMPHSGMTVVIDEVGSNDGHVNIYNLVGGRGKARMDEVGGMRAQAQWSTQVLSSGEYAMREHVEAVGNRRATGGQAIRMLDVPSQEVLERALAAGAPALPPAEIQSALIDQLKNDCGRFYGTALPSLVSQVLEAYAGEDCDLAGDLSQAVATRSEALCQEASQLGYELRGAQRRALVRLALMYVVGEWAVDGDVVPFTKVQIGRTVRAVRDAWLSTVVYVSEEDRILRNIRSYAMRYLDDVRDANPRTTTPPGGWRYFPLKKSGLLAFTEEQLVCASGSTNTVAVGKILSRSGWLHRNDARRHRCDVPAELRGLVDDSRIFMLVARPVLGDLLDTLDKNDRGQLVTSFGEPDEDGVLDEIETSGGHDA